MKWIEIIVTYKPQSSLLVEELISDIFDEAETGGVSVELPDMEPVEGWDPGPVTKPDKFKVKGYIPADAASENKCSIIETGINRLIKNGIYCELTYGTINDEDWAEKWKEYFRPEKISDTVIVKPTWRDYHRKAGESVIEIDPGMAFGTGTHPTTAMCVRLMETHVKQGDSFLDIGTGSGILMIAADKFGAQSLTGTDIDPIAVETAEKNILLNGIHRKRFSLITGNLSETIKETYDIVAANILAEIIMDLLDDVGTVLKENGMFICSGILEEKSDMIIDKMQNLGYDVKEVIKQDSWVAIAASLNI